MGSIKVYMPDDLENELRSILPARKGAISEFVVEAIREKIERDYGVKP